MTWIVGTRTPFGVAFAASDICVTFPDGATQNCLQKIYGVGNYIALGFAGSVAIGFGMLSHLASLLAQGRADDVWDPTVVSQWWSRDAMDLFYDYPPDERQVGCELIMLAAHPTENTGMPGWAQTYVYGFSSPRFEAHLALPDAVTSIGSGALSRPYQAAVERLRTSETFYELAAMHRGMQIALGSALSRAVTTDPQNGISDLFQLCTVERGNIEIGHVGEMPPLARSYREFQQRTQAAGIAAASACC